MLRPALSGRHHQHLPLWKVEQAVFPHGHFSEAGVCRRLPPIPVNRLWKMAVVLWSHVWGGF